MITGSDALLQALIGEGVDTIFGYPGGAIMPVYDRLYDYSRELRHILVRHEQGAVHAAQGYARVSGKVGVCLATSGPGATNLITGIADAMIDSTPLVCIVGQVSAALLGTDAFQETDMVGMSMPTTKWNCQVTDARDIAEAVAKAFYIAGTGRPGPVLIDFTKNAQLGEVDFHYQKCNYIRSYQPNPTVEKQEIEAAAAAINAAKKPFALLGQGVVLANAEQEVVSFLEKADIPFGWTILGKSAVSEQHPLNKGMLGMHGNYAPNAKTNECDVLIAMGMRFDDRVTSDVKVYAQQAKIVHLEIDKAEVNKNVHADFPVVGNLKETLPLLVQKINKAKHTEWIQSFAPLQLVENQKVIDKTLHPAAGDITIGEAVAAVSDSLQGNAILVTDVGQQQMIALRYFKVNSTRSVVTSGGLGTMGFGLPAAIGAKVAAPKQEVVLFVGDGGIQMTLQELGTIMQDKIGVKIVVLNNSFLGMVRQWQQLFHQRRYSFTPLQSPDYLTLTKAYGIASCRVTKREELQQGIDAMLNSPDAFLLEIKIAPEDNVFPMIPAGAPFDKIRFE
ncbi:acetolactate synthase [Bacteroidia bacterium]|nr:acetolactate synthase [Bacteroidia bacterium]